MEDCRKSNILHWSSAQTTLTRAYSYLFLSKRAFAKLHTNCCYQGRKPHIYYGLWRQSLTLFDAKEKQDDCVLHLLLSP